MSKKHNHAEAFYHMIYYGENSTGRAQVRIWNSRDGVTPFMFHSEQLGITLQSQRGGVYDPNYQPKEGDLIWRDYTKEEAEKSVRERLDYYRGLYDKTKGLSETELKEMGYDHIPVYALQNIFKDEARYVNTEVKELLNGQPKLELIK